jgi:hypothetical protein
MRTIRNLIFLTVFIFGFASQSLFAQAIIADHSCTDITAVPQEWIEKAKTDLHIGYGHTSHGSQITTGMTGLVGFANGGGKGLSLPEDIFAWNNGGSGGALDLEEGDGYGTGWLDHDCGYYPNWVTETTTYLDDPSHSDVNVIMWSWCGQAASKTEATMLSNYLTPMSTLEASYPGVTFVYMTGHANGTGLTGNLHLRNQQIRNYCIDNNKVLFDFYDIECYNPDGDYFGDKNVDDACNYTGGNWATEWQNSHTEGVEWYSCSSAHSQPLNANQKAYAIWWLWAKLAGWDESLPVQMADFYATVETGRGISIRWKTVSEVDCIGFHVWRSEIGSDVFQCLTGAIIPGQGNSSCGSEYCYLDSDVVPNRGYEYKVEVLYANGETKEFGPVQVAVTGALHSPEQYMLYPNYPNPFNPDTYIAYEIPESGRVSLAIFDITGREIRVLVEEIQSLGHHKIHWDGKDAAGRSVPSGIYISRLMTDSYSIQKKMTLMK